MLETFSAFFADFPASTLLFAGLFGAVIGSFLNVVIYRLPIMLENSWQTEARDFLGIANTEEKDAHSNPESEPGSNGATAFNLATPGSSCPCCGHAIRWYENVPLLSWLALKGRCSACHTPISIRYPLIEAGTAIATCMVIFEFGVGVQGLLGCLLTWVLITLSFIDYDHKLLPDNITLPFLWVGLVTNYFYIFTSFEAAFWGAILGYLVLWAVFWVFKFITGKEGLGYGDFKLLALLGAWLGWQLLPMIILLSSLSGAIIGGLLIVLGRDKANPIPFGPYLALAGWVALLWQDHLLSFYWRVMGL
ncbi:MAG: A24 family peptidase [Gammaproteobacteria bacterium]|nr:A24 family peptidase [Gammaproteobacteria bacterium]